MNSNYSEFYWHDYKYLPYEKELAFREIQAVLNINSFTDMGSHISTSSSFVINLFKRLTYFSHAKINDEIVYTLQYYLESSCHNGNIITNKRQSTRYSVHGLHEYKGKFNPQIAKSLLNILGIAEGQRILDPFCGSGTSLVESTQMGIHSVGFDINPLAVYISNAKLTALSVPADNVEQVGRQIIDGFSTTRREFKLSELPDERLKYLQKWFDKSILFDIETLYLLIKQQDENIRPIFFILVSNLLRDYSLQEPADLRIRRRKSPMPSIPFIEAFKTNFNAFINNLRLCQKLIGVQPRLGREYIMDSRSDSYSPENNTDTLYNGAITSPPYATALPYIDTQRLSLVWLDLCKPSEILNLEASLTGSREIRGTTKSFLQDIMINNSNNIPHNLHDLCLELYDSLSPEDGFRRRLVPMLLYRYLSDMLKMFRNVYNVLTPNAPFALVVGHNHTVLGGKRFDIDTPYLLAQLAEGCGWRIKEIIPLQTYQRYGLHHKNGIAKESLILLYK